MKRKEDSLDAKAELQYFISKVESIPRNLGRFTRSLWPEDGGHELTSSSLKMRQYNDGHIVVFNDGKIVLEVGADGKAFNYVPGSWKRRINELYYKASDKIWAKYFH